MEAIKSPRITMRSLKAQLTQTQDQLFAIQDVLEELSDRQEALSVWQIEFSKKVMHKMAESTDKATLQNERDAEFSRATEHLESVNDFLSPKKNNRREQQRLSDVNRDKFGNESILVIPEKEGLH